MKQRSTRSLAAALAGGALVAFISGCGGAEPDTSTTAAAPTTAFAISADPSDAADPTAGPAAGGAVAVTCEALLAIDSIPVPDSGPPADDVDASGEVNAGGEVPSATDPAANRAFGQAVRPHLDTALDAAPADLAVHLTTLDPIVTATEQGADLPSDDELLTTAIASYEAWAHANCGYQNVDLMAMDYEFEGVPTTLTAGPASFSLMNHSEKGESHVATLARLKPGAQIGLKQLVDLSFEEITQYVELVPGSAFAPPGATGGTLVDLTTGHYFLVCPLWTEENDPTTAHMFKGMLADFDVA